MWAWLTGRHLAASEASHSLTRHDERECRRISTRSLQYVLCTGRRGLQACLRRCGRETMAVIGFLLISNCVLSTFGGRDGRLTQLMWFFQLLRRPGWPKGPEQTDSSLTYSPKSHRFYQQECPILAPNDASAATALMLHDGSTKLWVTQYYLLVRLCPFWCTSPQVYRFKAIVWQTSSVHSDDRPV